MTISNAPKLLKGGLVLIDPQSAAIEQVITFQYNPESLSRTLQMQATTSEGDRSQPLRLRGPAVETLKLDVVLDAIDQLEQADAGATEFGIHPQLAVFESLLHPGSDQLISNNELAMSGVLEIIPMEQPLLLFIWSKHRILPVRLTDFSITEEAFDTALNPIRAKLSVGLRVLSVDDLGFDHKGGSLFLNYLQHKEGLAGAASTSGLEALGIGGIP